MTVLVLMAMMRMQILTPQERPPVVLFVCEHGSAKSLIARLWFERAAREAGLRARAESRATAPDSAVPDRIRHVLKEEGFDLGEWRPVGLVDADLRSAGRVVVFDVDLPKGKPQETPLERWDKLPAVSENYAVARDEIRRRVQELVRRMRERQGT